MLLMTLLGKTPRLRRAWCRMCHMRCSSPRMWMCGVIHWHLDRLYPKGVMMGALQQDQDQDQDQDRGHDLELVTGLVQAWETRTECSMNTPGWCFTTWSRRLTWCSSTVCKDQHPKPVLKLRQARAVAMTHTARQGLRRGRYKAKAWTRARARVPRRMEIPVSPGHTHPHHRRARHPPPPDPLLPLAPQRARTTVEGGPPCLRSWKTRDCL